MKTSYKDYRLAGRNGLATDRLFRVWPNGQVEIFVVGTVANLVRRPVKNELEKLSLLSTEENIEDARQKWKLLLQMGYQYMNAENK